MPGFMPSFDLDDEAPPFSVWSFADCFFQKPIENKIPIEEILEVQSELAFDAPEPRAKLVFISLIFLCAGRLCEPLGKVQHRC